MRPSVSRPLISNSTVFQQQHSMKTNCKSYPKPLLISLVNLLCRSHSSTSTQPSVDLTRPHRQRSNELNYECRVDCYSKSYLHPPLSLTHHNISPDHIPNLDPKPVPRWTYSISPPCTAAWRFHGPSGGCLVSLCCSTPRCRCHVCGGLLVDGRGLPTKVAWGYR